ncbi:MAG: DNA recombination protein RmuC, partial [Cellulomonas sp.]|nr:DNA recombination protein RmuC [Cellulomonas sp.]
MELWSAGAALLVGVAVGVLVGWTARASSASDRLRAAQVDAAQSQARRDAERAAHADRQTALAAAKQRPSEHLRALAADALANNNEQFLALAHQRLSASQQTQVGELAQREQA